MWLVDRNGGRARVLAVDRHGVARAVDVPGISGRDVEQLLVSRDGSRLVAVVSARRATGSSPAGSSTTTPDGSLGATPGPRCRCPARARAAQVRDIAWRTPTTVSVLSDINDDLSQVRTVSVDGAPGRDRDPRRDACAAPSAGWCARRSRGREVYAVAGDAVIDLTSSRAGPRRACRGGLTSLTYVG